VVVLSRSDLVGSRFDSEGLRDRCTLVEGSLTDLDSLRDALDAHDVRAVYHLGAQTQVGRAKEEPLVTWETNIRGTYMLLEAVRAHGRVERVVVASSDKAYGSQGELPYREDFPLLASFPYDVSKAATDMISRSYWHTYGLPVAVTRFANLYGGGDLNPSRLVPEAVSAALQRRPPVIRSDGTPERDFLYVEDAVDAYLRIAEALDREGEGSTRGDAFNGGTGSSHSVREIVSLVFELAGSDVRPDVRGEGTPPGEIDRQYLDATKLRETTGWQPRVALREGLERTVEWYRAHPEAMVRAAVD
jgi:CDP-glucose 4,6-dehydratase